jgi:predicted RNA-binding Zn-ribbon protein involved in translation (DUF1610 family)
MNCLVCGNKAEQIAATANRVNIHCPKCGEYDVESAVSLQDSCRDLHRNDAAMSWTKRSARQRRALAL